MQKKSYEKILLVHNKIICSDCLTISGQGVYKYDEYTLSFSITQEFPDKRSNNTAVFDADKLSFPMTVRTKADGDKMTVKGMNGCKKVSDIFTDEKIERSIRNRVPIILKNDDIIYLTGIRQSAKFSADKNTENYLIIECGE